MDDAGRALDYAQAGVDYAVLDSAKRRAQTEARLTDYVRGPAGVSVVPESRGESAFVFRAGEQTLATVLECLGTKSMLARQWETETGHSGWEAIGYDAVAAIVNDLVCVGALPAVVNAYFATGNSAWFADERRLADLLRGWRQACEDSGAAWGGGESPTLKGLVAEADIELAGSAVGVLPQGLRPILGEALQPGDEIVLVGSSGLHANGASLVREVAGRLPQGLRTLIGNDQALGAAALVPTVNYVPLVRDLLGTGVPLTYLSHITGHGLRKLMRADRELTYRIHTLPAVPAVIEFVVAHGGLSAREAYSTFNMGAGFAVYARRGYSATVLASAVRLGYAAVMAGVVERGRKAVELEPLGISFNDEDLQLR